MYGSAGLQPSRNSSMSPSIYELIITPPTVRKCYGCGNDLGDKYKTPPCNIIIKHVDKRVTGKDSATSQLIHSQDYSNTYYHPIAAHITTNRRAFCMRMRQYGLLKCHGGIFCELFTFSTSICRLFSGAE